MGRWDTILLSVLHFFGTFFLHSWLINLLTKLLPVNETARKKIQVLAGGDLKGKYCYCASNQTPTWITLKCSAKEKVFWGGWKSLLLVEMSGWLCAEHGTFWKRENLGTFWTYIQISKYSPIKNAKQWEFETYVWELPWEIHLPYYYYQIILLVPT